MGPDTLASDERNIWQAHSRGLPINPVSGQYGRLFCLCFDHLLDNSGVAMDRWC